MAGVEIDANRLADRVAQSEEGADTVDILVAVQFEAELPYAEASGISDKVPPIRDQHLFPLVAQDLLCLGRPARRHPIGVGIAWPTRAARHHDHPFDPRRLASAIVLRVTSRCRPPVSPGCSGLPEQLRALIKRPWSRSLTMNSSRAGALSSIRSSVRCGARDQLPAANSNRSMPSSAAVPRRSPKDSSPRLSVIMPIFIAIPSQARSRRRCTQISETQPGINERWRLCRILLGLDDQPAVI